MGTYSKVVSVVKPIDAIRTFIGGTAKDITSAWVFINGVRKQVFPTTEKYTEIFSKTSSGSYSTSLGFGKYKIVISGAGGAGGAAAATPSDLDTNVRTGGQNGFAGEKQEIIITVGENETKSVTGVIGQGGRRATVTATNDIDTMVATAGLGGTGYTAGSNGTATFGFMTGSGYANSGSSVAGGGAGGASGINIDGTPLLVSKGGNGGYGQAPASRNGSVYTYRTGTGGSGGTTTGTGAAGGRGRKKVAGNPVSASSDNGTDGYVYIYKSNIYPE